ncbi:MAG TPA: AGE family epimerase/isomerase [Roseiflexaceae bacterium]|nr:AGE family epimerase/isomerase [Roseiflexaceae bacterium]
MQPTLSVLAPRETGRAPWRERIERELRGNILPFWIAHTVDPAGGFYGSLTGDRRVRDDVPRSAVLCARVLWTYSSAYCAYGGPELLAMARHAYRALLRSFWDQRYGGVYWTVDARGLPANDRKHSYAQAFAIYGLSEFYRATGEAESLQLAHELLALLDRHAHDERYGGYLECRSREWLPLPDMRLSSKEPNSRKSMNTLLHLLEAFANLLRAEQSAGEGGASDEDTFVALRSPAAARLHELAEAFLDHVIDPQTGHTRLFFDDRWSSLQEGWSYGHDIETSWLLVDAAEALGDPVLLARSRAAAVRTAQAVHDRALAPDGALDYEGTRARVTSAERHWWAHAEALVGFYNAYQISGQSHFATASRLVWRYIEEHFVDHSHGDWFRVLDPQGAPLRDCFKVGPWECPYHHSRACLELLRRL